MSRSRKKHPIVKDSPRRSKKFWLRQAARKVRRAKFEIANGGAYKNLYDRYNICDWWFRYTWEQYLRHALHVETWLALQRGRDPKPLDLAAERRKWRAQYHNK